MFNKTVSRYTFSLYILISKYIFLLYICFLLSVNYFKTTELCWYVQYNDVFLLTVGIQCRVEAARVRMYRVNHESLGDVHRQTSLPDSGT